MRIITVAASALLLAGTAHAAPMSSYTTKVTPVGADSVLINDSEAGSATKKATLSSIVALSPSMTYPGAGVPLSTGSAWGPSYTVGTAANNLVQLNASAQLPAVSAALLTNFPKLDQNTTGTAGGLSGAPNITVGTISAGSAGFGVDADGDVTAKSVTVTRTASPSAVRLYEANTEPGDNYYDITLSGALSSNVTLNADQILVDGDIGSTVQAYDASLTTWAGITPGTGVGTVLATPSSANLRAAVTDESGTGVLLFAGGDVGAATSTGAVDFGGATSFEIPNGASPTVDAAGEVAVDTTSDQLIYYGTGKRVLPYRFQENFAIKSPVDADDVLMFKAQQAITITDIHVLAQGGGTISVDIQECDSAGANCATVDAAISADSDGAEDDGTLSNGAIDAGDWVKLVLAAPSGTVNFLSGSIYYTITAD